MPLSEAQAREHIHTRRITYNGFRRDDGLWDIEGHLTDVKSYSFPNAFRGEIRAGEPLHEMWIRLTLDEDFLVHDIEAATDAAPFRICPEITPSFAAVKGLSLGGGWRRNVRQLLGGVKGCTHLVELLEGMATAAYQTINPIRQRRAATRKTSGRPRHLDSCHALASDGEVVRMHWPRFYTGR